MSTVELLSSFRTPSLLRLSVEFNICSCPKESRTRLLGTLMPFVVFASRTRLVFTKIKEPVEFIVIEPT
jgi:hypothetical protein